MGEDSVLRVGTGEPEAIVRTSRAMGRRVAFAVIQSLGLAAGLVTVAFGWGYYQTRDPSLVSRYLAGRRFFIRPAAITFGERRAPGQVDVSVDVANCGRRPVRLLGAQFDCSCMSSESFPLTVVPGGRRAVPIAVHLDKSGPFEQHVTFFTDSDDNPRTMIRIFGTVAE